MRIFGSAVLMSLMAGGMAYSLDSFNSSTGTDAAPSIQDEMAAALAAQLGQTSMQLLQKNLNISPTLEIRPGYQFNVIVTQDMVFQKPYAAAR
jgi:type IV secretion system protein VirB10